MDLPLCSSPGPLATTVYLLAGGFRSDVQTDVLEFILMFLGFGIIIPFACQPVRRMGVSPAAPSRSHLTWHGGNSLQFVVVWFFIALWTLVDPSFHQRCYAAKSGAVAQRGILWSILFWIVFDAMTATAGLYARAILPDARQPVMAYPLLAEAILPSAAKGPLLHRDACDDHVDAEYAGLRVGDNPRKGYRVAEAARKRRRPDENR